MNYPAVKVEAERIDIPYEEAIFTLVDLVERFGFTAFIAVVSRGCCRKVA